MSTTPLRFRHVGAFGEQLRREAQGYLHAAGEHRFADARQWIKAAILLGAAFPAAWISLHAQSRLSFVASYVAFVMLVALMAVNFMHDAAHRALIAPGSRYPQIMLGVQRLLARLITIPLGIDSDFWMVRHVRHHHAYANVEGYDLDLEESFFLCQTPFQKQRPHHRFQHIYWPVIAALSMLYINWAYDWSDRLNKTPVGRSGVLEGAWGWTVFVAAKLAHFGLMIALPIWLVNGGGWPTVLAAYVIAQLCASCFIVALLLGTHWAQVEFFPSPDAGQMAHGWHEHALLTAVDWVPEPRWLGYWFGGLHRHATHHLFPTWHHRHYDALAVMVARVARQHGLSYRELSHRQLFAAQWRFLREMGGAGGSAARD